MSARVVRSWWTALGVLAIVPVFATASPARAQTFLLTGVVDGVDGPVAAGPLSFSFELVDGDAVVWTEEQAAVDVVGGVFAVDVGSAAPLPSSVPATARLRITVDGDALPTVSLAHLARAARAARAATTPHATETERVQGHVAADFVRPDALAVPGGPFVGFDHVIGVPPALADGDDGAVVASTAGGVVLDGAGRLALANVPGDRLADGSVTGARLQNSAVGTRHVVDGTITGSHVSDGSLGRAQLDADLTAREVRTREVFRVDDVACSDTIGTLTTASSCAPPSCVVNGLLVGRFVCGTSTCERPVRLPPPTCANTPVGSLVSP